MGEGVWAKPAGTAGAGLGRGHEVIDHESPGEGGKGNWYTPPVSGLG